MDAVNNGAIIKGIINEDFNEIYWTWRWSDDVVDSYSIKHFQN